MANPQLSRAELQVASKFVAYQIGSLVLDDVGRTKFIGSVDNVFEDIFGFKKLASKLNACASDREIMGVMNDFGMADLFSVINAERYYNAIVDLVQIDAEIIDLQASFKKRAKQGKRKPKRDAKAYDDLRDLYADTIKALRKEIGIGKKKSIKHNFSSAQELVSRRKGKHKGYFEDDYSNWAYFGDEDDDDEDEEDYENSPYANFLKRIRPAKLTRESVYGGDRITKVKTSGRYAQPEFRQFQSQRPDSLVKMHLDLDEDEDDDDEDEFDDDRAARDNGSSSRVITHKLDSIARGLQELINTATTTPPAGPTIIPKNREGQIVGDASPSTIRLILENQQQLIESITTLTERTESNDENLLHLEDVLRNVIQVVVEGQPGQEMSEFGRDPDVPSMSDVHQMMASGEMLSRSELIRRSNQMTNPTVSEAEITPNDDFFPKPPAGYVIGEDEEASSVPEQPVESITEIEHTTVTHTIMADTAGTPESEEGSESSN